MTQDFSNTAETLPAGTQGPAGSGKAVQIALRLHPVERSDRAIFANVSTARLNSSMVFLDFGFIEPQALDGLTRAARSGNASDGKLDGRLECRIAMSVGDASQLLQQLQRLMAARSAPQHSFAATETPEAFSLDSSSGLQ